MRFAFYIILSVILAVPGTTRSQSRAIDSLQHIIDEGRSDAETNRALNSIATEYTRIDMAKAKTFLYRSMRLAGELKNPVLLSYAYSQMVTVQVNTGHVDSAQHYLNLLKTLSEGNVPENVKANFNLAAGLFYKKQGNFKEALPYMINSLNQYIISDKIKSDPGSRTSIAGQCLNIGNTYMEMGDYKQALGYHLRSLKIFEEIANNRGISFCYQGICSDFIHLNQFRQAVPYVKKSIEIKKLLNDKRGIATSIEEYGTIYRGLQEYDKAVSYLNEALRSFREMKLVPEEAKADIELGKIYALKNDNTQAIEYFEMAKTLALQSKDSSLSLSAEAEMASLQHSSALQKKSEEKLLGNLQNSLTMGDKSKELSSYQSLADYYTQHKQFDKALEYTRTFYQSTDSVQNTDLQLQIKKMEEQYNIEKKENEIAILKRDQLLNQEKLQNQRNFQYGVVIFLLMLVVIGAILVNRYRVVQKAKRAVEMEKMRNKIARDLHDDIGSTLSSINILSKTILQSDISSSSAQSALQKIKDHSGTIMNNMSDIVWAINPLNDTLEKIIVRIKVYAAEVLEPLNINYSIKEEGDFSGVTLDLNRRKDFYLVCKEAINNAAKYSRCKNVTILLKQQDDGIQLIVSDDGIGFDEEKNTAGNGLRNMESRASAMNAGLRIISSPGKGTLVKMDVPVT